MVQLSGTAEVSHRDCAHKQHCTSDCDAGLSQSGDSADSSLNMGGGFHSSTPVPKLQLAVITSSF